jgi:uncharacterized protein YmfQ (DUF2313 family)
MLSCRAVVKGERSRGGGGVALGTSAYRRPENPWVWLIQLTKDTTHWNEAVLDRSYECSRATS